MLAAVATEFQLRRDLKDERSATIPSRSCSLGIHRFPSVIDEGEKAPCQQNRLSWGIAHQQPC